MADVKIITSQRAAKKLRFGDQFVVDVFPELPADDDNTDAWEKKFQAALVKRDKILAVVDETLAKQTSEQPTRKRNASPSRVKKAIADDRD